MRKYSLSLSNSVGAHHPNFIVQSYYLHSYSLLICMHLKTSPVDMRANLGIQIRRTVHPARVDGELS